MFDYITYQGHKYQTKDTYQQALDNYEIREDGTLWRECYTLVLHDDPEGWLKIRMERKTQEIFKKTTKNRENPKKATAIPPVAALS